MNECRLTPLRPIIVPQRRTLWLFQCSCGNTHTCRRDQVNSGLIKSCGCLQRELSQSNKGQAFAKVWEENRGKRSHHWKHGETGTPMYRLWSHIKERVSPNNPDPEKRRYYHDAGVRMHPAWTDDYAAFRDYILATIGPRPSRLYSLDRVDPNGHYEPGNLRWATPYEQTHNRRPRHR